ncbi:MAG TPA: carboxypeptidase-like regulatory domain-containing protein, partial [Burkholderiaceae bacterium]
MMHPVRSHKIALALLGFAIALSTHAGELEGNVLDQNGKPVANALVAAIPRQTQIGADGNILRHLGHSDAQGHFLLQGLPADSYGATATASGMEPAFIGNLAI